MTQTSTPLIVADVPAGGRVPPAINDETRFFWDGARQGRLMAQECAGCGVLRHPPGPTCPHCLSLDWYPVELSGSGRLYSYTVVRHPPAPGFDGPAIVVIVELDEGVRVVSNMGGIDPDSLLIGERLEVYFVDQAEGWTAPQFRRPQ